MGMDGFWVLLALAVLMLPVLVIVALVGLGSLKQRVRMLEHEVAELRAAVVDGERRSARATAEAQVAPAAGRAEAGERPEVSDAVHGTDAAPAATPAPARPQPPPVPATIAADAPSAASAASPAAAMPPASPPPPGAIEKALDHAKRWLTTGNVPIKVGMLVLLAGVAALLKLASEQGWLRLPIELRLAGVSLAALAGLAIGWRQRLRRPQFALAVQGGAIGVLLLCVFAAARLYGLMPLGLAFALSVALIAAGGVLAVVQDSRTLAVLAVLAGFLAPIWLADGGGNHVVLFTYYALLNVAIFGVAWARPWRILPLLGFVFTWGIGVAWGVLDYAPHLYATTQPFLALLFLLYLLLPILHARRLEPGRGDRINGALLFGTPLIAFALQSGLMPQQPLRLALIAVGVAAVYAVLAWWLRGRERFSVLVDAYALLAIGFATLAVPLAFSAHVTGMVFALEGAALVWYGLRRQRRWPVVIGIGLQLVAGWAHAVAGDRFGAPVPPLIFNSTFMAALVLTVAGFASAWRLWLARHGQFAAAVYLWAMAWWIGAWSTEINNHATPEQIAPAWLALSAFSAWLAAEAWHRLGGRLLLVTVLAGIAMALPQALVQIGPGLPIAGLGGLAWALHGVLGVRSLSRLRGADVEDRLPAWAQTLWWLSWPLLLSVLVHALTLRWSLGQGWDFALVMLPWLLALLLTLQRGQWLHWPLGERFTPALTWLGSLCMLVVAVAFGISLFLPGDATPLPWVPLINPLELWQLAALALGITWLRGNPHGMSLRVQRPLLIGVVTLVWISMATLRSVHHWGGEAWNPAMLEGSLAQTSLSVVWSVLGVLGWIVGSRRGQRGLWLAGALLMGLVLAKLVLVDRQHLGNLLGIMSFIAYGLLCTLVGWLAPAPPKSPEARLQEDST
ncbi:DUF2339 domain-containing protein [Luteimonas sp. e5]